MKVMFRKKQNERFVIIKPAESETRKITTMPIIVNKIISKFENSPSNMIVDFTRLESISFEQVSSLLKLVEVFENSKNKLGLVYAPYKLYETIKKNKLKYVQNFSTAREAINYLKGTKTRKKVKRIIHSD